MIKAAEKNLCGLFYLDLLSFLDVKSMIIAAVKPIPERVSEDSPAAGFSKSASSSSKPKLLCRILFASESLYNFPFSSPVRSGLAEN